jgi:hypothetical protein
MMRNPSASRRRREKLFDVKRKSIRHAFATVRDPETGAMPDRRKIKRQVRQMWGRGYRVNPATRAESLTWKVEGSIGVADSIEGRFEIVPSPDGYTLRFLGYGKSWRTVRTFYTQREAKDFAQGMFAEMRAQYAAFKAKDMRRNPARISRSGLAPARYVSRPSQITRKRPTKRLAGRRRVNLRKGAEGFFPNPGRAFDALYGRDKSHLTLRRAMPRMTKAEHIRKAEQFAEKNARLKYQWGRAQEAAHRRTFGKAPEFHDYKISGIGRDEYSAADKNKLHGLAHAAAKYGDASLAHWNAAGKTTATWRRMYAEMQRRDFNPYTERGLEDRNKPISRGDAEFSMTSNPIKSQRTLIALAGRHTNTIYGFVEESDLKDGAGPARKIAQKFANAHHEPIAFERVQVVTQSARMLENPAPRDEEIAAASRRFSRFTGHKAERVEMARFPSNPKAGLAVGPVVMLGYVATRDGKTNNYLHRFARKSAPQLVASHDGKQLFLIGGSYAFTDRGIVDKR